MIDDDERVLSALRRLLSTEGYRVEGYTNAEEFLRQHDPDAPGCAVVDLNLPGMDGLGIQRALSSGTTERPLIFLTGQGDIPSSVEAMKGGAIDFLTKPVDAPVLLAAVAQALERDGQARQNEAQRKSVDKRIGSLTPREREVLARVVAGLLTSKLPTSLEPRRRPSRSIADG